MCVTEVAVLASGCQGRRVRGGARERDGWMDSRAELVRGEARGHLDRQF